MSLPHALRKFTSNEVLAMLRRFEHGGQSELSGTHAELAEALIRHRLVLGATFDRTTYEDGPAFTCEMMGLSKEGLAVKREIERDDETA